MKTTDLTTRCPACNKTIALAIIEPEFEPEIDVRITCDNRSWHVGIGHGYVMIDCPCSLHFILHLEPQKNAEVPWKATRYVRDKR